MKDILKFNPKHINQVKAGYMNQIMHICANDDNHETEDLTIEESYISIKKLVYNCREEIKDYKDRVGKVGREW